MNTDKHFNTPFHQAEARHQADDEHWNTQALTGCCVASAPIRVHPCSSVVSYPGWHGFERVLYPKWRAASGYNARTEVHDAINYPA
jgi:hypothetical protein